MDLKAKLGLHLNNKKPGKDPNDFLGNNGADGQEKDSTQTGHAQVASADVANLDDSGEQKTANQSNISREKVTLRDKLLRLSGNSSRKKSQPEEDDDFSSQSVMDFYDDDFDLTDSNKEVTSHGGNGGQGSENPSEGTIDELIYEPLQAEYHLTQLLPAQMVESELGEYLLAEYRYPLSHWHGRLPLDALHQEELSALCGVLKDVELVCPNGIEHLVFVDTETTGLAGGAGTYAFLVGVGYFTEDEFVLQQYLMEDYHQELAMLDALHQKLLKFTHLVTFNGKSFDWPLLQDRLTYHRMRGHYQPVHVDLLHPARRYYKERLENCRLGSLEDAILGFIRTDDISGAEVPALFFSYLEEKDGRVLMPVMQHNHWDILSLVTLLTHLVQAYTRPTRVLTEAEDLFSAGKVYEGLGQHEEAINCYSICLERVESGQLAQETLKRLSFIHKKAGQMEEACKIWHQFVQRPENSRIFPYLELAKNLEHQCKDYQQALEMTQGARELVLDQYRLFDRAKFKEILEALEHREQRLTRKMEKAPGEPRVASEEED